MMMYSLCFQLSVWETFLPVFQVWVWFVFSFWVSFVVVLCLGLFFFFCFWKPLFLWLCNPSQLLLVYALFVTSFDCQCLSQSCQETVSSIFLFLYFLKKNFNWKKKKKPLNGNLALSVFSVLQKCWRNWTSSAERKRLQTWKLLLKAESLKSTKMF